MRKDSNIGMKSEMVGYYGSGIRAAQHPRRGLGLIYRVRRHTKPIGVFLVLMTAALVGCAVIPALLADATAADVPVEKKDGPPGTPLYVLGYVYDALGAAPTIDIPVTVTDNNTGAVWLTVAELVNSSFYMVDVRNDAPSVAGSGGVNWSYGDVMWVYATDGVTYGSNDSVLADPYVWIDVTMNQTAIPEFPTMILPVLGMVGIAAVVSLKRRRGEL